MQRLPTILISICGIALGGVLLTLSVPRTMAAFTLLPVETIHQKVFAGDDVPIDDLVRLRETQKSSLDWAWDSETSANLARTEIAIANATVDESESSHWYGQAALTVEDGLLKAPSNPYSWARLTNLRLREGEDGLGVSEPLILSLLTGPYEKNLVFPRIKYALRIWDRLSEDQKMAVQDQIVIANRFSTTRLVKIARSHQKNMKIIVSAMAGDLIRFQGFIKALNK
jgi:hypothetical protein